jgi:hypothetical protein
MLKGRAAAKDWTLRQRRVLDMMRVQDMLSDLFVHTRVAITSLLSSSAEVTVKVLCRGD